MRRTKILLPLLISTLIIGCGGEKEPELPSVETLIKEDLAEHIKMSTAKLMSEPMDFLSLTGPTIEVEQNEAAGVAEATMQWAFIAKEDLYLPNLPIQTEESYVSVIKKAIGSGEEVTKIVHTGFFGITDGIPILQDAINEDGGHSILRGRDLQMIAPREDFSDDAVILGSDTHKALLVKQEEYAKKQEAQALEQQRIAEEKRKAKALEVKNRIKGSLAKGGEFSGLITAYKPRRKDKAFEYRLVTNSFKFSESGGEDLVTFELHQLHEGEKYKRHATFEGRFNEEGKLQCSTLKASGGMAHFAPLIIKGSKGKIALSIGEHVDRIIFTGQYDEYVYEGELVRK